MAALMNPNWYNNSTGRWESPDWQHCWWHCANILEVVVDYSKRTSSTAYYDVIANTFTKNKTGNILLGTQDNFINNYYDDEGWWALAWIKAFDLTGIVDYLNMAETIFADMTTGWYPNTCGGGIRWRKKDDTWGSPNYGKDDYGKGAIQNELFMTAAARLYQRTSNSTYLTWAQNTWNWFSQIGLIGQQTDPSKNYVKNMINNGLCQPCTSCDAFYTYNQGVILGGLVDLYKITKDSTLLARAQAIANAVLNSFNNPDPQTRLVNSAGILIEICESTNTCAYDGPQFKGIFMRNLSYLYETDPTKTAYRDFITKNADSIWLNNRNSSNQFGLKWAGPLDTPDAVKHSSALDAMIAAMPFDTYTVNLTVGQNSDGRLETFHIDSTLTVQHNWQTAPNGGWSGWGPLGSAEQATSFTVGQNANSSLELFAIGADSYLYRNYQTNNWTGWSQLPGGWQGKAIKVGRNTDGRLELFVIGLDNVLYHNWQASPNADSWSGWYLLGPTAQAAASIAVGQNANGALEVSALGTDSRIYRNYQTNNWIGWSQIPGNWQGKALTVGRNSDGRLELFLIGLDNQLYHNWQASPNADNWSGWYLLGPNAQTASTLLVGQNAQLVNGQLVNTTLEVFALGLDGYIYRNYQANDWIGWSQIPGGWQAQVISLGRNADGRLELFVIGRDNQLYHNWQTSPNADSWSGWNSL